MVRKRKSEHIKLRNHTKIKVRFSEVDSMHIVWHGEYVRYFACGREAFGKTYPCLVYIAIYNSGYTAPMVDLTVHYILPLCCNDISIFETKFIST